MGIGDFVSNLFGSKNKTKATAPTVNQSLYQYGGHAGGADEAARRYAGTAQAAQGRGAEATNLGMANEDRAMGYAARAAQGQVGAAQLARAMGQTPSIAGMQAQQDMQRMQAQQTAQAGSARGAAGIAGAQRNAAYGQAAGAAQISNQAQINAANERLAAEQAAAQTFNQMRGGDQNQQGLTQDVAKYDAGLRAQQRAQNDAFTMGMTGYETGVQGQQLAAGMNYGAQTSANSMGAQGINAGVAGQNASMNQSNAWGVVGALQNAAGGAAGALGKAAGGPVQPGQPYVVGERGPELIVPKTDGVVIPNHALGRSPGINPTQGGPSPADVVISTWGTGPGMTRAQAAQAAEQRSAPINAAEESDREADARLRSSGSPQAVVGALADQHAKDEEKVTTVRSYQDHDVPVSERDEYEADNAERRLSHERRIARGQRGAAGSKVTLSSRLAAGGNDLMRQAGQVDTSYHGSQAYVPPMLIPINGARAMGGPVGMGGGYLVGEQGPELMVPRVPTVSDSVTQYGPGSQGAVDAATSTRHMFGNTPPAGAQATATATAPTSFAGSGGLAGGSVGGEDAAHKAFGARFARNPMAYGDADGGPVPAGSPRVMGERGPEVVVPLGNPMPGVNLHVGDDGRAFYQHDVTIDDGRPRIESRGGGADAESKKAKQLAKAPPKAAPPKTRAMTDEELLREADRQIATIHSQEASSMAQGPAVRVPVQINKVAKKYALADFVPQGRKRQAVESSDGAVAYIAPPIDSTLPPPRPPPIEAQHGVAFDSPNETAIYDYARTMQGQGQGAPAYDIEETIRRSPSVPFWKKFRQSGGGR